MRLAKAKRLRFLSLALVLVLVVAACGDGRDDDEGADDGDGTEEPTGTTGGGDAAAGLIDAADCPGDPTTGIEGNTIKIGTSLPQSGPYSGFSQILRGEQAYFQYLNEELGGVEIDGEKYTIELIAEDDQYAADQTVTNVNKLINDDRVFALFNVVGTKNNLAIRDLVSENCVPNLFAATGSPAWGNKEYPWILGTPLVPYPAEMYALVEYLKENQPAATIAILHANDDFGRSYAETLEALVEGTDLEIVATQAYDAEGFDVATQVTNLAASDADVFVIGATLLACPNALNEVGGSGWDPLIYMSGTCTSKTLVAGAGANAEGVISVAPIMDPSDPQYADNEAMVLYKEKVAQYGGADADPTNGIVAYGWSVAALLAETLQRVDAELTRESVMETARTLSDVSGIALQLPGTSWGVDAEDWFLGEQFNLVQYSVADGYFSPIGELISVEGRTAEITPESLVNS
jgi:branched-chain amino acid transport system substrate-binding protein